MAEEVYLGVDLGAESGRVIAGTFDGERVELEELHRFENHPATLGETIRWDVIGLWSEIERGLMKSAERYGDRIASVGVDTWGVDYVLMSKHDEILGQPYHYRDSRNAGMLDHALSKVSKQSIFERTGIQFMEINTLYQLLACKQYTPELLETADRLLMMPDFFHWCLSGSRVVEFTNATTSQCYHPTRRDWSRELLSELELPTEIFPEVVGPGENLGKLRKQVRQRTGLGSIDVIAPATHDTGAAIAAVPTTNTGKANWAYISSGTWSLLGVELGDAILTEAALAANITNEGGIDGTYRLLKNIMGLWLVQRCRRSFEQAGASWDYERLMNAAREAVPLKSFVDPDDHRFLNPEDMPTEIAGFCRETGQPIPETEGEFIRTALESLALKYRHVLRGIEGLTGERVEVIHIVGGGCRNELLDQLTANACGVPVLAGPVEATVLGNVLVQARSHGRIGSLAEIREVVGRSFEIKRFEPQETARWEEIGTRFSELITG